MGQKKVQSDLKAGANPIPIYRSEGHLKDFIIEAGWTTPFVGQYAGRSYTDKDTNVRTHIIGSIRKPIYPQAYQAL